MTTRKLCRLSPEIAGLLTKQLAHELKNYNLYKSFSNFFGVEGIVDLESYYNKRAAEEKNHAEWIHSFLTDGDYKFNYPTVEENKEVANDFETPFNMTVDREIQTTQMIYNIHKAAIDEGDLMTASWLYDHLVKEQIEEEDTSRMALSIMTKDADLFVKAKQVHDLLEW